MKLVKSNNEYYLIDDKMSTKIGEVFAEKHLDGEWSIYHVDTLNDLIHDGFKIIASTNLYLLANKKRIAALDREQVEKEIHQPRNYSSEELKLAIQLGQRSVIDSSKIGNPTHTVEEIFKIIEDNVSEWEATVKIKDKMLAIILK